MHLSNEKQLLKTDSGRIYTHRKEKVSGEKSYIDQTAKTNVKLSLYNDIRWFR